MTGFINENENFADSTAKRAYHVIAKSSQFHDQIKNELINTFSEVVFPHFWPLGFAIAYFCPEHRIPCQKLRIITTGNV